MTDDRQTQDERGTALIVTMLVLLMLMSIGAVLLKSGTLQSQSTLESRFQMIATAECEAGIALALRQVELNAGAAPNAFMDLSLAEGRALTSPNGTTEVFITDHPAERVVQVEAQFTSERSIAWDGGRGKPFTYRIQAYLASQNHPAFYKAIFVGNAHGLPNQVNLGPSDGASKTYTWNEAPFVDESTRLNEETLGLDLNGDGDRDDQPKISDLALLPAWSGHTENSGTTWRIDLDKNGAYTDTHSNTLPYEHAAPAGTETPDPLWSQVQQTNGDYVEGDVYVNGDVNLRNETTVWGDINAVGFTDGEVVTGAVKNQAPPIAPPDLHAQNYEANADEVVTPATVDDARFFGAHTDPTFYAGATSTQDNGIVHLGPNTGGGLASFSAADDKKLIFVKGNLWLHSETSKTIELPAGTNITVTIVVEGNLYIGDDLDYGPNTGVLFLVKGRTDDPATPGVREDESFVDSNKNYVYDVGEPIVNDDGNGTYDGPKEGQGNIYFMDVKYGTGGVTDGFMYAENNAYVAPTVTSAAFSTPEDYIYGVNGFLSAGGVFSLADRASGSDYINYKVKYDPRIENGTFSFKGLPKNQGGSYKGLFVTSWRVIPPQ